LIWLPFTPLAETRRLAAASLIGAEQLRYQAPHPAGRLRMRKEAPCGDFDG